MALNKSSIQKAIEDAFKSVKDQKDDNRDGAIEKVAGTIADAVVDAIKSAEITYTTGLTTPTGGGPVTGKFGYTIS